MNTVTKPLFEALEKRLASEPLLARLELLSRVRPSVRLTAQRVTDAEIEIGESRIGGLPDVPPEFKWPRWAPSAEHYSKYCQFYSQSWRPDGPAPLGFIAQVDLSALPRVDDTLPDTGWLYYFYDRYSHPEGGSPSDRGSCRVIYANPDRSSLVRSEPPPDAERTHLSEPCCVQALPELILPDDLPDVLPELEYGTPAYEAYLRLHDELVPGSGHPCLNRFLGHPQLIQNPMELECQLASNGVYPHRPYQQELIEQLESGAADWRLFLQIDSDEEGPGWMWDDCGRIYFWIKQQDLKSLRLDDVWLISQSC